MTSAVYHLQNMKDRVCVILVYLLQLRLSFLLLETKPSFCLHTGLLTLAELWFTKDTHLALACLLDSGKVQSTRNHSSEQVVCAYYHNDLAWRVIIALNCAKVPMECQYAASIRCTVPVVYKTRNCNFSLRKPTNYL